MIPENRNTSVLLEMPSNLNYVDMERQESFTILGKVFLVKTVEWSNQQRPLTGTATYSFREGYEGYTMVVKYKNQKMNGRAMVYTPRGIVYLEADYVDNELFGRVVIRDERGAVAVKGTLHNGLREGVFTYKDKKDEYYYQGRQITRSNETDGYCLKNEKGKLESVSQFTKDFSEIDGLSYEYEGGTLKRLCEYKQGKQVRLLREWKGSKMTEYNPQGKREYEGGFGGSLSEGFYRNGKGTEYHDDGRSILYDGHWSDGVRSGEGTWYKNTNGLPTYIGTWDNNVPNGKGALMDKNGEELYSGSWENGYLNVSGKKWVDFETGHASRRGNKQRLKKWVERGGEEPEGCWKETGKMAEWIWNDAITCPIFIIGSLFILLCSLILFGYSLSRYGWWGWLCPVLFIGLFVVLVVFGAGDYALRDNFLILLVMRCLLGAISIASYHLFGVMATSGRKGAFIMLIVLCSISVIVHLIIVYVDCNDEDKHMYVYTDMINMLSFISLSLVSSLFLSPWVITVFIILRVVDFLFRDNSLMFISLSFIELLYLSIMVMLRHTVLLVITIMMIVYGTIAALGAVAYNIEYYGTTFSRL